MAFEYNTTKLYVDGKWVSSTAKDLLKVRSPSTEEIIGCAPSATTEDIDRAVMSARAAFDHGPWPRMSMQERGKYLRAAAAEIMRRKEEFGRVTADESGLAKVKNADFLVQATAFMLNYYADLGEKHPIEELRQGMMNSIIVRKEPIGVVGSIMPWNAPIAISHMSLAPALMAGCCVILKPAPETPLYAQLLAEVYDAIGMPPGVFNVTPADREVSEYLVRHQGIDKISFTGSTQVGRRIGSICGEQIKRFSLELGGKSAAIVLEDADLSQVMPGLLFAALINNCEACVGQTRILAPANRYDEVLQAFAEGVARSKVGDPHDPETDMGPLISERQRSRVEQYIEIGKSEGAKLVLGGGRVPDLKRGYYVQPTVFANVNNQMRIAREEIFGPVFSVIPYRNEEDAIAIANDSTYGLSGTVWTSDQAHGVDIARRVRTGNYGVNCFNLDMTAPFGGFKESGIGRQYGIEGLQAYFELKSIHLPGAAS